MPGPTKGKRKRAPAKASAVLGVKLNVDTGDYDTGRHGGRQPTVKLTEDLVKKFAAIVAAGNFRYVAAQSLGIPQATITSWCASGRKEIEEFVEGKRETVTIRALLLQEIEKAEANVHQTIIRDVVLGDNMPAKLWYLERRYNKLYTKNPNAYIDDEAGKEITREASDILVEKLASFIKGDI